MTITIEISMDATRIAAAMAEVKREGGMRRGVYPRLVESGKLTQVQADAQIRALADAYRVIEAAVVATEELPYMAGDAAETPRPTTQALPVLPYDKTSLSKGPPLCRFCGRTGTRSKAKSADVWTCDTVGCMGNQGYVPRGIFEGVSKS